MIIILINIIKYDIIILIIINWIRNFVIIIRKLGLLIINSLWININQQSGIIINT